MPQATTPSPPPAATNTTTARRRGPSWGGLVRVAIAAGLTAWMLAKSHPAQVLDHAQSMRIAPLLWALALVLVDRTLMAYRWLLLLRPYPSTRHASFFSLLRIFFVSTFVGTFLPAGVGSDAVRAAAMKRLQVPLADAVASVFMDRVLGVLSVLLMAAIGLSLARELPAREWVLAGLLAAAGGCAVATIVTFSTRGAGLIVRILERLPIPTVRKAAAALIEAVQRYASHHGLLAWVLLASIAVQILRTLQAYYLGRALNLDAPLLAYFAFIPVIVLVMQLPISINGLGTAQAGFVTLFAHTGMSAAGAFALSLLFTALGTVGNLPGGLLYLWGGLGPSAPAAPPRTPAQPAGPASAPRRS